MSMFIHPRGGALPLSALFAALTVFGASLPAQGNGNRLWNVLPKPLGTQSIATTGTTGVLRTANQVYFYSGILKRWESVAASATAIVDNWNAFATVQDGNQFHGYASRRGDVDTITVNPGYKVYIGPASANWITMVHDGNQVHAFSPFTGRWATQTLASANVTLAAGAMVAVAHDGIFAYGFSAYHGKWVQQVAPGTAATVSADGLVAMVNDSTIVRAFGAGTSQWATQNLASTANPVLGNSYAIFVNGNTATAFSGERGTITSFTAGTSPGPTLQSGRESATFVDGDDVVCYSGPLGSFHKRQMKSATITINSECVVLSSMVANETVGWSPMTGEFSAPLPGTHKTTVDECVALCESGNQAWAYSPILGVWSKAPATVFTPTLLRESVLLQVPGGYLAFSSRYPGWSRLDTSPTAQVQLPRSNRGALLVVHDGNRLHAWDTRLGRWTSTNVAANPSFALYRVIALAHTGSVAHGFGLFGNEWESIQVQGTVQTIKASSSIGTLETDSHIYMFSAHGALSTDSRFPEFSRFQLHGTTMRLILSGTADEIALTMLGTGPGYTRTPFGTLFLDPAGGVLPLFSAIVPPDGRLELPIAIPNDPSLRGRPLHLQDFVVPANGWPWLSNSIAPVIV